MDTGINRMEKQSHDYGFKEHEHEAGSEGSDAERTLKMVASGFIGTTDQMADVSIRCFTYSMHPYIHASLSTNYFKTNV